MTARRLVLVRHAKSLQDGGDDQGRPLNDRGEHEAPLIGRRLAELDIRPDHVVLSPARRTQQTWQLAAAALDAAGVHTPEPVVDDRIYHNSVEDLAAVVIATPAQVATLAIVGHNPSLRDLVLGVAHHEVTVGGGQVPADDVGDFSPGSVAVLRTDADWADVHGSDLRLESVWSPPRG